MTAQYISSVHAKPTAKISAPASITPRAAAAAKAGPVTRASNPMTPDFALKCCATDAVGDAFVNIHTDFAANVIGFEAG